MSDQHPTPQWYAPRGGTATDTNPYGAPAQPTAPIPTVPSSTVPPPPGGPFGPTGPSGAQATPSPRSGRRRTAEITAVAVLAALLSSGGTIAAVRLFPDDAQTPVRRVGGAAGPRHRLRPGDPGRRRGPGLVGHRGRRLPQRREHHRDAPARAAARAPASSSTRPATC